MWINALKKAAAAKGLTPKELIDQINQARIQKEKKQTHVRNKLIETASYESWVTMPGDDTGYSVVGFDPTVMLPDEDVYKPKKKVPAAKKGLENFMEDEIDMVAERGHD